MWINTSLMNFTLKMYCTLSRIVANDSMTSSGMFVFISSLSYSFLSSIFYVSFITYALINIHRWRVSTHIFPDECVPLNILGLERHSGFTVL